MESRKDAISAVKWYAGFRVDIRQQGRDTSDAHAPLVLAGVALPHPASSSLTLLVRVIHPFASDDKTALPFFGLKVQCARLEYDPAQPSMDLDSLSPLVPVLLPGHEVWMTCKVPVSQAMFISGTINRTCGMVSELAIHAAVTYMPCPGHLSL